MATLNTFTQKAEFTLSNKNLKDFSDKYPTPFYGDDSNFICPSLNCKSSAQSGLKRT